MLEISLFSLSYFLQASAEQGGVRRKKIEDTDNAELRTDTQKLELKLNLNSELLI